MSNDMYKKIAHADIQSCKDVPREKAIRLYCTQNDQAWCLQVRAPERLANQQEGKSFYIASAGLYRSEMIALRDAITTSLAGEMGSDEPWTEGAARVLAKFDALSDDDQVDEHVDVQECLRLLRTAVEAHTERRVTCPHCQSSFGTGP